MALFKGKGSQTVKKATVTGDRRSGPRGSKARQEEIGVVYTQQKHECTSGPNGCDSPCPLAHPTA